MSDILIYQQGTDSAVLPDGYQVVTSPLIPSQRMSNRLSSFTEGVYDLSPESHLSKLLKTLLGDSGVGQLHKRMMLVRLNSVLGGTHFFDLDAFYGAVFGVHRRAAEQLTLDPYRQNPTVDEWDALLLQDASYRSRVEQFAKAMNLGATAVGIEVAAEALLSVDCDVRENWTIDDRVNQTWDGLKPGHTWDQLKGSSWGALQTTGTASPVQDRHQINIIPHRPLTLEEQYDVLRVVERLRPAGSLISVSLDQPQVYRTLVVANVQADSELWWINSQISNAPVDGVWLFGSEERGWVDRQVPAWGRYQGEAWSHLPAVPVVVAYTVAEVLDCSFQFDPNAQDLSSERVVTNEGTSYVFLPQYSLKSIHQIQSGRSVSDGILIANPYSGVKDRPLTTVVNPETNFTLRTNNTATGTVLVDGADLGEVTKGNVVHSPSSRQNALFWTTPSRSWRDPAIDIVEIRFSEPKEINFLSLEYVHFPHRWECQAWNSETGCWEVIATRTVKDSVPYAINGQVPEGAVHPYHYGDNHWLGFKQRVITRSATLIRFVVFRFYDPNLPPPTSDADEVLKAGTVCSPPLGFARKILPYPLGFKNIDIGYRIENLVDVGRITPDPLTTTKNILDLPVQHTVHQYPATNLLDDLPTYWKSEPQPVGDAVVCLYFDMRTPDGQPQVIDAFEVDPLSIGQNVSIYWSDEMPTDFSTTQAQDTDLPPSKVLGPVINNSQGTAPGIVFPDNDFAYLEFDSLRWDYGAQSWWGGSSFVALKSSTEMRGAVLLSIGTAADIGDVNVNFTDDALVFEVGSTLVRLPFTDYGFSEQGNPPIQYISFNTGDKLDLYYRAELLGDGRVFLLLSVRINDGEPTTASALGPISRTANKVVSPHFGSLTGWTTTPSNGVHDVTIGVATPMHPLTGVFSGQLRVVATDGATDLTNYSWKNEIATTDNDQWYVSAWVKTTGGMNCALRALRLIGAGNPVGGGVALDSTVTEVGDGEWHFLETKLTAFTPGANPTSGIRAYIGSTGPHTLDADIFVSSPRILRYSSLASTDHVSFNPIGMEPIPVDTTLIPTGSKLRIGASTLKEALDIVAAQSISATGHTLDVPAYRAGAFPFRMTGFTLGFGGGPLYTEFMANPVFWYTHPPIPVRIEGRLQENPAADPTSGTMLRYHPSLSVEGETWGFVGGQPDFYSMIEWNPIGRDFALRKGVIRIPQQRASFIKFEFSSLVPEPWEPFLSMNRKIKRFQDSTTGEAPRALQPWTDQIQTAVLLGGRERFQDQWGMLSVPPRDRQVHSPTAAIASVDEGLSWVNKGFGRNLVAWQPWASGRAHYLKGVHEYQETWVAHTAKIGFFAGLRTLKPLRTDYSVIQDRASYDEYLFDLSYVVSPTTFLFNPGALFTISGDTSALLGSPVVATSTAYESFTDVEAVQFSTQQSEAAQLFYDDTFKSPLLPTDNFTNSSGWHRVGDSVAIFDQASKAVKVERDPEVVLTLLGPQDGIVHEPVQPVMKTTPVWAPVVTPGTYGGIASAAVPVSPRGVLHVAVRLTALTDLESPLKLQIIGSDAVTILAEVQFTPTKGVTVEQTLRYILHTKPSLDGIVFAQVIQSGQTQGSWLMHAFSCFDDSILWEWSNDGGVSWIPAYDVKNNFEGAVRFATRGRALRWRATAYRRNCSVSAVRFKPWYVGKVLGRHAYPQRGPNLSAYDDRIPIQEDPGFSAWTNPIPQRWFSAHSKSYAIDTETLYGEATFATILSRTASESSLGITDTATKGALIANRILGEEIDVAETVTTTRAFTRHAGESVHVTDAVGITVAGGGIVRPLPDEIP